MNYTKYRFNLDMQSHISQISLPVRQRDTGINLYISLTDGGVPYTIKDGCRAVFSAKKADGNAILNDCVIERNTLIRYELTEQTTICSGVVDCELRLFGTDGSIITSPRFIMVVDERVVHDEDIPLSESEMSIIDNIISNEEARIQAEEARVIAEGERQAAFEEWFHGGSPLETDLPLEKGEATYTYKQKAPSLRPNKAFSQSSISLGENCIAGCKGYYISEIYFGDTNNNPQVRLSSSMPILSGLKISSSPLSATSTFVAPKYSEGAYFNITCADHYFYAGSIKSVNHDVITFEKYLGDLKSGFQQSANNNTALLTSSSFRVLIPGTDDYTFWVPAESEIGVLSVSALANTDGSDNIAAAIMSTSIGRENISGGAYSFTFNRGNIAGYCAFAGGFGTEAFGKYSGTVGFHTKTTSDAQFAGGFYNKIDLSALFMIGNGTSEENRSNIFSVHRDGILIGETKITETQLKDLIDLPNELETALDAIIAQQESIIAIQKALIGGGNV